MRRLLLLALLGVSSMACAAADPPASEDPIAIPDRMADNAEDGRATGTADPIPSTETPPSSSTPAGGNAIKASSCESAKDLGSLAGDFGAPKVTYEGSCSEWLKVRVLESSTSVIAAGQKLRVTLIAKDVSFELRAFVNKEFDRLECALPAAESLKAGSGAVADSLALEWGETFSGNNADDSRTVNIQVKSKDAMCQNQAWTLIVEGNQ